MEEKHAIEIIDVWLKKLDEISSNEDYGAWSCSTALQIARLYGEKSSHLRNFEHIRTNCGDTDTEKSERYRDYSKYARTLLYGFIAEIDNFGLPGRVTIE